MEDPRRLYLRGLPYGVAQWQVRDWLWSKDAAPQSIFVHFNDPSKTRCSAYLHYTEDARHLVPVLDGSLYNGLRIQCSVAKPKAARFLVWHLWGNTLGAHFELFLVEMALRDHMLRVGHLERKREREREIERERDRERGREREWNTLRVTWRVTWRITSESLWGSLWRSLGNHLKETHMSVLLSLFKDQWKWPAVS